MLRTVLLALVAAVVAQEEGPIVQTAYGTVRGIHNEEEGYSSFTGIRYAQAPTGRNRFRSASPPPSWEGIFEANRNDIACPQIEVDTFIGVEDCLTLNVYKPDTATSENPVAVMVYFYGGAFVMGSVPIYSEEFLMKHDVVVVFVNFRVSALGYLCLRHELIPGNAAFKDQVAALLWVQQNIAAFGGDPDNVTIFGHSAGGVSVDLLTLSPIARGLFHKAVVVSGSARAFWAVNPDPIRYATTMAQTYLGYSGNSIEDLVEFYLNSEDKDLAQATTQYYFDLQHRSLPVAACVEDILPDIEAFLLISPTEILLTGQYTPIPIIYVAANKEYLSMLLPNEVENIEDLMQNLETNLPNDLVFQSAQQRTEIANRVHNFYVKEEISILESFIDYKSDTMFYYAVARAAKERPSTPTAPIYMLEFTYESERHLSRLPETAGISGAAHGDDLLYLILTMHMGIPLTPADQLTIDRYTKFLTNFAKHSNPTPNQDDIQWLPMTENQFHYLELGSEVTPLINPNSDAIALWDQIYVEATPYIPLVQTAQGWVRGTHHSEESYFSFMGIRYATAPTGRNRFTSASLPPSWDGIFEANRNDIACPQIEFGTFFGVEDCLTLNIYRPDTVTSENPVPVVVYFHGGAFVTGSVRIFSGEFLIKHDVIVVLANFRISALGHLCLRHELIPGNAAFKDQVAALRWLQQNIAAFGGDPDNVTILGHSAGGASVDLLTLSPMADGLFHKAVAISGSARAVWAVSPDPIEYATSIAQTYLGYDGDSIEDLVETYLNAEDKDLAQAIQQYFLHLQSGTFPVAACVEKILPDVEAFLTSSPTDIILIGGYTPIPMIYAVTDKEYVNMIDPAEIDNAQEVMQNLETYLPDDLVFQSDQQRTEIASRVRNFYVKDEISILESYIDYRSDMMFYYAVARAAKKRPSTATAPIYMLEFTYASERRFPRLPETDGMTGAAHGDDMLYLILSMDFGLPLTPADQLTIDRYTTLLTNFAKYNNPTPDLDDLQWLPVTENQFHYLDLGSEVNPLINPHQEAVALWDQIYNEATLNRPLVQTAQGWVRGTRHSEGSYSSFMGIHYATAPTGRNRFTSASPPPLLDGIFDANRNDIACLQLEGDTLIGVEDCLTLNIYKPDAATPDNPMPVLVYFHGGAFIMGSVIMYSEEFLIKHDVVVVLVNFRINALGHLCLRHELIPGNAAFKDQIAALLWLRQNIAAFGGDPDNVTIMGHSAGGASVDLLTLSPMADGLFHKAIAISGSARSVWAVTPDPIEYATSIAQTYLDYNGDDIDDLVEAYLNAEDKDLAQAIQQYFSHLQRGTFPIAACVEEILPGVEAFLTSTPIDIILNGQYTPIPKLYGVANKEYVNIANPIEAENAGNVMQNLENYLPDDLVFQSEQQRTEIANRVREFYVKEEMSILESYIDYMSDMLFYYGVARAARKHPSTSTAPIYMLEFAYESERRLPRLPETAGIAGAAHGDDMLYLILSIDFGGPPTLADQLTIERYTTLLTNFMKYSNPTPNPDDLQWPPMTEDRFHYLELGSTVTPLINPNAEAIALWDQIYIDVTPNAPLVQTAQGWVRGTRHPEKSYSSFTGVRYATAPTGRNRFTSALPPPLLNGIFDANRNDIACLQLEGDTLTGIEDCLTLNIYKPDVATPENPVPIIVYFHGGAFIAGSGSMYSEDFLIKHDVVVVLVNFRVNALGHLCLRHELIPGNAAFKDQVAALRWLRENIAAFGGDPDNVTIMGHSAGGASVDLLTLSPMADGLFHKAVAISGSARSVWAVSPDPIGYATSIAQTYLGYNGDSIDNLVETYLNAEDKDVALAILQYFSHLQRGTFPIAACVEQIIPGIEAFLTTSPTEIIVNEQYTPTPMIYAVANKEYVNMADPTEAENAGDVMQNLEKYLPDDLVFESNQQRTEIANRVRDFYVKEEMSILESYIDYMSDMLFYYGVARAARKRPSTSTAPIYMLEFAYESERRLPRLPETAGIAGAAHGDDMLYLILSIDFGGPPTPADQLTIERYTTLLTNFAKYGNPTVENAPVAWQPLTDEQFHYLKLSTQLTISQSPNAAAIALWDEIYASSSARLLPPLIAIFFSTFLLMFNLR